jgi:NADH-quinone oxidoreductase subunit G/[NiFe] hydrogenase diaphorase moiety small subunit
MVNAFYAGAACRSARKSGIVAWKSATPAIDTNIQPLWINRREESVCINCDNASTAAQHRRAAHHVSEMCGRIADPRKHVVIQTAPAPRAAIAECFGIEPGRALTFELNTALRQVGFDKVFDTNFSADLTILEEGTELLERLYHGLVLKDDQAVFPQFTSCSPGWVKYLEHFYPEMIPNLSSAKSPQQMFGALIKTHYAKLAKLDPSDIVTVALMPCTARSLNVNVPKWPAVVSGRWITPLRQLKWLICSSAGESTCRIWRNPIR